LTPEKTLRRKLHDALLARRIERALTKDEILETYLNSAFWGDRTYGAEAAARAYFNTSSGALDCAQAALLASLLPNPRAFDPCRDAEAAERRRNRVLDALARQGEIDTTTHRTALGAAVAASCLR
jgi:membrane peptidoglycan carboxypeptidase